jgi:hypothetical protein
MSESLCMECGQLIAAHDEVGDPVIHGCDAPVDWTDALERAVRLIQARVAAMDPSERAAWLDALFFDPPRRKP